MYEVHDMQDSKWSGYHSVNAHNHD